MKDEIIAKLKEIIIYLKAISISKSPDEKYESKLLNELIALESQEVTLEMEEVSAEEVANAADEAFPSYDEEGVPDSHSYSFCTGAEWMKNRISQQSLKVNDRNRDILKTITGRKI